MHKRPRVLAALAALCVLALAAVAARALAAGGDLDANFSGDGKLTFGLVNGGTNDTASDVAVQSNGKIVVVGPSTQTGPNVDFAVARVNPGGGLDQSFSGDGMKTFGFNAGSSDTSESVAIGAQGRIVVAGYSFQSGTTRFAVAVLNQSGGFASSFSGDGRTTFGFPGSVNKDLGYDVAVQADGKVVVAGRSNQSATSGDFAVARLNTNGNLDQSFSGDGKLTFGFSNGSRIDYAEGVAIQPNGQIVMAGTSNQSPSQSAFNTDFAVARLNPGGRFDQGFSGGGRRTFGLASGPNSEEANDVAIQANGKIVMAGYSQQNAGNRDFGAARLNSGGGFDQSFSNDGRRTFGFGNGTDPDYGNDLAIQPNGKVVVAGYSFQGGSSDLAVARLNTNGNPDQTFSGNGKLTFGFNNGANGDTSNGVAIHTNGKIVIAGGSVQGGVNAFAVARLLGS